MPSSDTLDHIIIKTTAMTKAPGTKRGSKDAEDADTPACCARLCYGALALSFT